MLMLATSIRLACAVTQSTPHTTDARLASPLESMTRTAHNRAPGATPTYPKLFLLGAAMAAPWVPCPRVSSWLVPSAQLTPPATRKSGCVESIPVSMIATSTLSGGPWPLMCAVGLCSPPMRSRPKDTTCGNCPGGTDLVRCDGGDRWNVVSAITDDTWASPRRAATCWSVSSDEKPSSAVVKTRVGDAPTDAANIDGSPV